jgi:hypothetical protein
MRLCAAVSGKWTCTGNLPCFGPQRSPLSRPGFWRSKPERRDHRQRRAEATASGGGSKPMAHDRRPAPSRAPPPAPHTPPARPSAPTRWLLGGAPPVAYPAPATCSSRSGHDLNKRMESPLHMAAYKGLVVIIDHAWVNQRFLPSVPLSGTPLHQAVLGGHIRKTVRSIRRAMCVSASPAVCGKAGASSFLSHARPRPRISTPSLSCSRI